MDCSQQEIGEMDACTIIPGMHVGTWHHFGLIDFLIMKINRHFNENPHLYFLNAEHCLP